MKVLLGILLLIAIFLGAIVLTVAAFMMLRGTSTRHGSSNLGHAMQELEGLFVESKKHVIEEQREDKRVEHDAAEGGDAGD